MPDPLPRNSMRANTKAARLQTTSTLAVDSTVTTRLLRIKSQKVGAVRICA